MWRGGGAINGSANDGSGVQCNDCNGGNAMRAAAVMINAMMLTMMAAALAINDAMCAAQTAAQMR